MASGLGIFPLPLILRCARGLTGAITKAVTHFWLPFNVSALPRPLLPETDVVEMKVEGGGDN